jgi:tRNA (uracil-5-)-methyltransferase TRM9
MPHDRTSQLNQLNRQFYTDSAESFSRTRTSQWEGWSRALPEISAVFASCRKAERLPQVLDLGCGNGRFLAFLQNEAGVSEFSYHGVDLSATLLQSAALVTTDPTIQRTFSQVDLVEMLLSAQSGSEFRAERLSSVFSPTPDLIVLFGVMHHIPSLELRKQLLSAAWRALAPGGALIITFWQFANGARFAAQLTSPETTLSISPSPTKTSPPAEDSFSHFDYLLPWQKKPAARYAHHFCDAEIALLTELFPPDCRIDHFAADGKERLNYYLVLKKNSERSITT